MTRSSSKTLFHCAVISAGVASCHLAYGAPESTPVTHDITAIGSDQMAQLMSRLQTVLNQKNLSIHVNSDMRGSSVAISALADGIADIAPLGRVAWPEETEVFKSITNRKPVVFYIGYAGWGPDKNSKMPPAIYVNSKNMISGMTLVDVARAITTGQAGGDINTWAQAGATDSLASRHIHVYGARDDGRTITALRIAYFAHHPFKPDYEGLDTDESALDAVASDQGGIALVGWVNPTKIPKNVRILPISESAGKAAVISDKADIANGAYPLRQYLELYVDPGEDKTRWQKTLSFVEVALSDAGQSVIHGNDTDSQGFLPLAPEELAQQRALLQKLISRPPH